MRFVSASCVIRWSVRLSAVALFVGLGLTFRHTLDMKIASPAGKPTKASRGDEEICVGLVLSPFEGGGRNLVSAEKICTRRIRKGPFSFALRELVVDNLMLTLPESRFHPPETNRTAVAVQTGGGTASGSAGGAAAAPAFRMSDLGALMSGGGRSLFPSAAGLRIRGLMILRLEGGTNTVPWLLAYGAKADIRGGGLRLGDSVVFENGRTNDCTGAILAFEPYLHLQ